ncbi:MAG TPA: sugar phosphate isomerase/epimerase family protein [Phycisphaerae bacterium]|nr:sugar phosphate isomerase/epimerase family protein [Phycisphaerae bacterium]HOJ72909.1 sugar phosphate isomerase/epimerase family protein [Phycisphaerae bacterium]HOM50093.1 sugar phosphate isomerase/epimerase family protein [Phycisphaerae bacterium]HON65379.1 sugar phosphate isomerase/epimerase family protein [Phycisphaerae bacterium]HOQ86978.1 sugar phosphate isomerase/epimerase family protein [Phycisphaerae bacterium]
MAQLQIGVCTWSLHIPDLGQTLATIKDQLGLGVIHLGFFDDGYKEPNKIIDLVKASGLKVSATCLGFAGEDYTTIQDIARTGGYLPDDVFEARYEKTVAVADITPKLGTDILTVHIGFVPEDHKDPKYAVMVDRARRIADALGERGVKLVMETGQESPENLIAFMDAVGRPNVAVNFDPANMILYGVGEPVEAVSLLRDRIAHVHMKDATWSAKPREQWGEEVVLGTGEADIPRIVSKLRAQGYTGTLAIEREAGNQRVADIAEAIKLLKSLLG